MAIEDVLPTPPEGWKWKTDLVQVTGQDYIRVTLSRTILGGVRDAGFVPGYGHADCTEESVGEAAKGLLGWFHEDLAKYRQRVEAANEYRQRYEHLLTKR